MKTLYFLLVISCCFATRFQTVWERMEFPADSETKFIYGLYSCGIGDINKDGYADFLVNKVYGSDCVDTNRANNVFLYLGKNNLSTQPDLVYEHKTDSAAGGQHDGFGCLYFNGLGDINGDGYDDFAIVAHNAVTDTMPWGDLAPGGKIYIYFGNSVLDTIPEMIIKGHLIYDPPYWIGDRMPSGICGADVNGDGYNDIVIGFREYSTTWNGYDQVRGRVYIYFGGTTIDTIPDVVITGGNYWAPFPARYEQLGWTIDNLGDVNGDGYEDIIVGAPNNMEREEIAGKAYVFLGGNPMDTLPDWWYYGTNRWQSLGEIVSNAGDFNGDGYNDFMIGDYMYPMPWSEFGRVLLFYGGPSLDTIPDWQLYGEFYSTHDLGNSLDCIGDYNNDGYDDIVIGNSAYEYNGSNNWFNGRILLFLGGASPDTILDGVYIGAEFYERGVARVLGNVGDVNGDGLNEIIFTTDYPPIVPYPDVYGWVRVAKITEAGLPDSIICRGGDCYCLIKWQGKYEENTSHYQILKNNKPDTLGWYRLKTINPRQPPIYTIVDTAVDFSNRYYYWVRVYDRNGKFDHYGPFHAQPSPIQVNDFTGYRELSGYVNLYWCITGGDITGFNLYQEINHIREKIATLGAERNNYAISSKDQDVCYWLGIMQSSNEERLIGPLVPDGIVRIAPNPFRNQARIGIRAGKNGIYSLKIYNVLGQYIKTLWSGEKQAGYYEIVWDGKDGHNHQMPAGVYYLVYEMGNYKTTAKLVRLK